MAISSGKPDTIVIFDFGSQVTQLIARRIRARHVHAEIVPYNADAAKYDEPSVKGFIFSGGPASVYAKGSPHPDPRIFMLGKPILGICYGLQLLAYTLGGKVERGERREYGKATLAVRDRSKSGLFYKTPARQTVWMSHGDAVKKVPKGFAICATSAHSPYAAVSDARRKLYGVQFHPEVWHTEFGMAILENFARRICGARAQWTARHFISEAVKEIRSAVGKRRVVHALSGGVDSTVLAMLLKRALPPRQVNNVFVDNGVLRLNEAKEVRESLRELGLQVHFIDAAKDFLRGLRRVVDPEEKRKVIGRKFVEVLMGEVSSRDMLSQGTLYPDVIESVSVRGPSDKIKTHHNRAPEVLHLIREGRVVEPLKELFKDEVREVGKELGVPDEILWRHPFPGPGLAIGILGEVTAERLHILRAADAIFIEEITRVGLYRKITEAFAALDASRAVGVKGDEREYGYMILLRAITTTDFMTADWYRFDADFLARVANRIINEVRGVTRVLYDVTQKPPGTIRYM
jgi:GMP synthase (glutamine-hydrolysing)